MIDLAKATCLLNRYNGSEQKRTFSFEGKIYMVKFPDRIREKKNSLTYMNNQFAEHIGSGIFESAGFAVQKTELVVFPAGEEKKIVVVCEDFTKRGERLIEASKVALAYGGSKDFRLTISHCLNLIAKAVQDDPEKAQDEFLDRFVIDALIANPDRHLGNWGFIEDEEHNVRLAPVYDCGSSLAAKLDPAEMETLLSKEGAFKSKEYNIATAFFKEDDSGRLLYHEAFAESDERLMRAIKRTVPKIDLEKIRTLIDNTAHLSDVQKTYLFSSVKLRYDLIHARALKNIQKKEHSSLKVRKKPSLETD